MHNGSARTNSVAIFVGGDWLIPEPVKSPQANRCGLGVTVFELIENVLDFAGRLWTVPSRLANWNSGILIALPYPGIKMNGRCHEVDVRDDVLWQMVAVAGCGRIMSRSATII
jgi:hypothetical protein